MRRVIHLILGLLDPFGRQRWQDKVVLIGLTEMDANNEPVRHFQAWGRIVNAVRGHSFLIELDGHWRGYFCSLPPDPKRFTVAPRGDYSLKTTGETLRDPDFTTVWVADLEPGDETNRVPGIFIKSEELA
jgi:hypothetical protein